MVLSGPFAAELMNRFGVRRVIAGSLLLVSSAVALVAACVVVGSSGGLRHRDDRAGLGCHGVNRWFAAQRGVVMDVLTASIATGQLIFLPILAALVERHGWRSAAVMIAGSAAAIVSFTLFIRERPGDIGLAPYGAQTG